MSYAPIALFTYNRADKSRRVLDSLLLNSESAESDLYIFSDGPKNEQSDEKVRINREFLHNFKTSKENYFKSISIIEREKNLGLANSLITGISEIINKYGKVIVVEDDLILSPYFLKFMNDGLIKYKDEEKVGTITGYVPPLEDKLPETFFLSYFQCWGWATWKRAWNLFETDSRPLLRGLRFRKNKFDVGGGCGNYGNLYCQKVGLVDSWYLRFYASLFLANKLSLYPGYTLTENRGMDGSGVHCKASANRIERTHFYDKPILLSDIKIEEDEKSYKIFRSYFSLSIQKTPRYYFNKLKSFVRRFLFIDCH